MNIISLLQEKIAEFEKENDDEDSDTLDYHEGIVDGILIAIKTIKEALM